MSMRTLPHPGEFIQAIYMEPFDISCRNLAKHLDVAASTLNRVIKGPEWYQSRNGSKALGRSPESWLTMQDNYDLSLAKKRTKLKNVFPLDLSAA
jgi:antitoxin HigA-1